MSIQSFPSKCLSYFCQCRGKLKCAIHVIQSKDEVTNLTSAQFLNPGGSVKDRVAVKSGYVWRAHCVIFELIFGSSHR